MASPKLALPYIAASSFSKEISWNQSQNLLDALVQLSAVAYTATPPGSPTDGQCWLVAASPTGAWVGHAQDVAMRLSGAWIFCPPQEGWLAFDQTLNGFRHYTGTTWEAGLGVASATLLSLTDVPDAYTGQALKLLRVNAGATAVEFVTAPEVVTLPTTYPYDLAGSFGGACPAETVLLRFPFPRAASWAEDAPNSQAVGAIPPADDTALLLKKNAVEIGQIAFAAFATVGTFTLTPAVSFTPGDILTLETPEVVNGLGSLGWAFALTRSA